MASLDPVKYCICPEMEPGKTAAMAGKDKQGEKTLVKSDQPATEDFHSFYNTSQPSLEKKASLAREKSFFSYCDQLNN